MNALVALGCAAALLGVGSEPPRVYLWCPSRGLEEVDPESVVRWGGLNAERGRLPEALRAPWVAGRASVYLGHAPGRFPLYLERDQVDAARAESGRLGARPGELFRPETWDALRDLALGHVGPLDSSAPRWDFVSLGDELSFSPWGDPLEFAATAAMQAAFDQWRGARGRPPADLDRATWRVAADAGSPAALCAFVDRRRFEREWFTERVADLADELHRAGVEELGVLGLYGSPPFGGLAVDALVQRLEVSEPYPEGLARRRVASVAGPGHRWLTTLFLDAADPARDPCLELWRTWSEGGSGFVVWNADHVRSQPERANALLAEMETLRRLCAEGTWIWEGPRDCALLVDDDQLAFEWLTEARRRPAEGAQRLGGWYEAHGRGPRLRRAWLDALERAGLHPGVLRPEALAGHPRFRDLIALEQTWLGADQARAITEHLERGGRLWLAGRFGILDELGQRRTPSLGERLNARFPGQVRDLEPLRGGRLSSADRAELLARAEAAPAPWTSLPAGWSLRRGTREHDGQRFPVVALVRAAREAARAPVPSSAVATAAAAGWRTLHGPNPAVWLLQGPHPLP